MWLSSSSVLLSSPLQRALRKIERPKGSLLLLEMTLPGTQNPDMVSGYSSKATWVLGLVEGWAEPPGHSSLAARERGGHSGKWAHRATWQKQISQLSRFPRGEILWLGVMVANSCFQIWFSGPGKLGPCLSLFLEVIRSFFGFLFPISHTETSHEIIWVSPCDL